MKYLHIFLIGIAILTGAILLNIIAKILGIQTWFDFVNQPASANFIDFIWLFIAYPFCLGLIAYLAINPSKK